MFLSSGALTQQERRTAFAAVPDFPGILRRHAIASRFVEPIALPYLDGLVGGFAREAFAAHADATYLLVRAAGQVAESRAAELFCERTPPDGWLDTTEVRDANSDERLRRSLATIPLEAAGVYLDAALNHEANAIVRFAFDAGFDADEVKALGLRIDQPVTQGRAWTSWRRTVEGIEAAGSRGSDVAKFVLADALVACGRDADVAAVIEFRDDLVHRGVPVDLDAVAVRRATEWKAGEITVKFPLEEQSEPQLAVTRETLARAVAAAGKLADAVHDFLPPFAEHIGFGLRILQDGAEFSFTIKSPGGLIVPATVIHTPTGPRAQVPVHGTVHNRPRQNRDRKLFMK